MAAAEAEPKPWPLPDDVTREIFARARYNNPLYIYQVASFCKDWHRALSDADFAQRLRHHRVAPVPIGFLHDSDDEGLPTFVPTIKSPFVPINIPDRRHWSVMDYRHGRGLFMSRRDGDLGSQDLMVWDPVSGDQRPVPVPLQASEAANPGVALFCTVPGCDHRPACNGGEFKVAMLFSVNLVILDNEENEVEEDFEMNCLVYSSETDTWEQQASLLGFSEEFGSREFGSRASVVAGQSVYFLSDDFMIFELDLATHALTNIELPDMEGWSPTDEGSLVLMVTDQGELGMVEATGDNLFTWSRSVDDAGNEIWNMGYTFDHYFTSGTIGLKGHFLLGFAEGTKTFFVSSREGTFYFELPNAMVNEAHHLNVQSIEIEGDLGLVFPIVSLYSPYNVLQQGFHQNGGQQHVNQPNDDEAPSVTVLEAAAETATEEASPESKKRLNVTCDDSSPKRNKQNQAESGKEQVPEDAQPAVSGRAAVQNSADSGKSNGPRD